jgi:chromosome partitioning protein
MSSDLLLSASTAPMSHVVVVGNEKGGAGKSTVAMHLVVALLKMGRRVGVMDLDLRQRSLTRYLDNRAQWSADRGVALATPWVQELTPSTSRDLDVAAIEETARFEAAIGRLGAQVDVIVIDAPGSDTHYSRLAHGAADTLITPLNDSFIDFDLLGDIDPLTHEVVRPSVYSEMVWEARKRKAQAARRAIDWVVMRNRTSTNPVQAKNNVRVGDALKALSNRIGFRLAPGLAERVIYRELFPRGLTLMDLDGRTPELAMTMSHVAARQEIRDLMIVLKLPGLEGAPLRF